MTDIISKRYTLCTICNKLNITESFCDKVNKGILDDKIDAHIKRKSYELHCKNTDKNTLKSMYKEDNVDILNNMVELNITVGCSISCLVQFSNYNCVDNKCLKYMIENKFEMTNLTLYNAVELGDVALIKKLNKYCDTSSDKDQHEPVYCSIDTNNFRAFQALLSCGFTVDETLLRLICSDNEDKMVLFNRICNWDQPYINLTNMNKIIYKMLYIEDNVEFLQLVLLLKPTGIGTDFSDLFYFNPNCINTKCFKFMMGKNFKVNSFIMESAIHLKNLDLIKKLHEYCNLSSDEDQHISLYNALSVDNLSVFDFFLSHGYTLNSKFIRLTLKNDNMVTFIRFYTWKRKWVNKNSHIIFDEIVLKSKQQNNN